MVGTKKGKLHMTLTEIPIDTYELVSFLPLFFVFYGNPIST
jgi:hypothetical protein